MQRYQSNYSDPCCDVEPTNDGDYVLYTAALAKIKKAENEAYERAAKMVVENKDHWFTEEGIAKAIRALKS